MAKTKEQRAAAHQRQLARISRKRQGGTAQVRSVESSTPVSAEHGVGVALLQSVSQMHAKEVCLAETQASLQSVDVEVQSLEMPQLCHDSVEITDRRRSAHGRNHTELMISVTSSDSTSKVERSYGDFEALLAHWESLSDSAHMRRKSSLRIPAYVRGSPDRDNAWPITGYEETAEPETLDLRFQNQEELEEVSHSIAMERSASHTSATPQTSETDYEEDSEAGIPSNKPRSEWNTDLLKATDVSAEIDAVHQEVSVQEGIDVERPAIHDVTIVDNRNEVSDPSVRPCKVAVTESIEEGALPAEMETVELNFQSQEEEARASVPQGSALAIPDSDDLASALEAYEEAFHTAVSLKLQLTRMAHPAGVNKQTAVWWHQLGKVKLQTNDVNGAIDSLSNAEAIYRHCDWMQTLDGANLLQDLGAAKLQIGDDEGVLKVCEAIYEYAGSLQSSAAKQFLNDCSKLWHALAPSSIFAAACALMDAVNQEELEKRATHRSQGMEVAEATRRSPMCTAFLKFGRSLLCLCSPARTNTHE